MPEYTRREAKDWARATLRGVCNVIMPTFPQTFYPESADDVYEFIARFAAGTDLALTLFCAHQWNFGRIHPSEFPPALVARLADVDTVVAAKYEVGRPAIAGVLEVQRL